MKGSVASRLGIPGHSLVFGIMAFLFVFLIFPLLYVFVRSFYISGHLDFGYFLLMFRNPIILDSIRNSLTIGIATTVLTAVLSLPLSYILNNYRFPGKGLLQALLLVPLILPPFVGAIGMKKLFARFGSINLVLMKLGIVSTPIDWFGQSGMWGIIILLVLHLYPIMFLNLSAAMANVDPSLEEAALSAGASRWKTLQRVTLPLMLPGFFAGAIIVFIWALTDLGTPLIFDFQKTIPVQIFSMVTDINENPIGYALVVLVIVMTFAFFLLSKKILGSKRYEMLSRGHVTGRERPASRMRSVLFYGLILGLVTIALIPHISVMILSLSGQWFGSILPASYTLSHYGNLLSNALTSVSIKNSFTYSILSTLLDIILGIVIAYILTRKKFRGANFLDALVMLPLALPGVILAFGYVATFSGTVLDPKVNPVILLVLSYGLRRLPYMVRSAYAGFQQTSITLEEAASGLGASTLHTIRKITLPLITANIIAGSLLCFSYAMLEVSDSLILAMREKFYPITKAIYILASSTSDGYAIACALGFTGMLILTASILVAGRVLGKKMGELFRAG